VTDPDIPDDELEYGVAPPILRGVSGTEGGFSDRQRARVRARGARTFYENSLAGWSRVNAARLRAPALAPAWH
jgi:hypothetical protein